MKPLYCSRKLLKSEEFIHWMDSNNIIDSLGSDELHLTVAYSSKSVDWDNINIDKYMLLVPRHNRKIKLFGNSLVLTVSSSYLKDRWEYYMEHGCSWDFPEYAAHISLSYNYKTFPTDIEPFQGDILLGPEILKDIEGDSDE